MNEAMSPHGDEASARDAVVAAMRRLDALGLNRGSTGNASIRWAIAGRPGMLITPTGAEAATLSAADLTWVGDDGSRHGRWQPSSEWLFHQAVYRERPDLHAVLHTHAPHATALACLGRPLPAFHYMVAVAGGSEVPLAPYQTFGSAELAEGVAQALKGHQACLMAQHGLVTASNTIDHALKVMLEVESLCQTYLLACAVAEPPRLPEAEMARVLEKFRAYGQRRLGDEAGGA